MQPFAALPDSLLDRLPDWIARDWLPRDWNELGEQLRQTIAQPLAMTAVGARSGLYFAESIPLLALQRLLGSDPGKGKPPPPEAQEFLLREVRALAEADADRIARGVYPASVLLPRSSPLEHAASYVRLLIDSVGVASRKRARKPREFTEEAARLGEELPDYYRRNFHYQTDGYLSEASAELYEHQVEILFRGLADAMRRLAIEPLKQHFGGSDGRGLRFLELAAGCGTATRFMAEAFPEASITAVDLSQPYVQLARRRLADHPRVAFLQGDATDLDMRGRRYDAVYSVFLFHELPGEARARVASETRRVLRSGGAAVMVDSLQYGDAPDLDWALRAFPKQFHEPYYHDYARTPLRELLESAGLQVEGESLGLLSKCVHARR